MQSSIRVLLAIAVLGSTLCLGQAQAQTAPQYVYSVKFLCGLQTLGSTVFKPPQEPPVKPGNYATAVNIHNFHNTDAVFAKKAVIALPERQKQRGPVSTVVQDALGPDQALEVDCTDIVSLFQPSAAGTALPPFIKGFVEIVSPVQLSVTAVYTAQTCKNPKTQKVSTQIGNCSQLGELDLEVVPHSPFVVQ